MKKMYLLPTFLFAVSIQQANCESINQCDSTGNTSLSRSFFRPRAIVEDPILFFALNNHEIYKKYYSEEENEKGRKSYLASGVFYEQSTNGNHLAKYFLPNDKSCVSVQENGSGDIGSVWLNVIAPAGSFYSSKLCLKPQRSVVGGYFNWHQEFCCYDRAWIDLRLAVYQARHNIHACEVLTGSGVQGITSGSENMATALDFLNNCNLLQFGRIAKHSQTKSGIDDIDLKLGYDVYREQNCGHLGLYGSVLIPTAPKPKARYMFEPLIGRGHAGVGGGFNADYQVWEKENNSLVLMSDFSYQYLFSRTECRSFDLTNNGNWSRYLKVVGQLPPYGDQATIEEQLMMIETIPNANWTPIPAINEFTFTSKVTPRGVINFWTALHFEQCAWHAELGYNLWWRQAEKVRFNCKKTLTGSFNSENFMILDLSNVGNEISASTANISQAPALITGGVTNVVVGDTDDNVYIKLSDLNLKSGSCPHIITNKIYAAVGYDVAIRHHALVLGLGGSFEFANKKALQQWGIWGNVAFKF